MIKAQNGWPANRFHWSVGLAWLIVATIVLLHRLLRDVLRLIAAKIRTIGTVSAAVTAAPAMHAETVLISVSLIMAVRA